MRVKLKLKNVKKSKFGKLLLYNPLVSTLQGGFVNDKKN